MFGVTEQLLSIIEQYGVWGLVLMTLLDSFISPIPPEVLFIPLCLMNPNSALLMALITTSVSVVGAMLGYWLGQKGGRPLLLRFFRREKIIRAEEIIKNYGAMAVLIVAFTPVPFKLITITSGVLNLPLRKLLFWSTLGRGARFFLEAGLIIIYGRAAVNFLESSNFALLTMFIGFLMLIIYLMWAFNRKRRRQ
ncbi:YqaA family protein [Desulfoscipio gibsoniae]|uniref:Putative membrane protein n=1 Tax=Desulfoscipio gibsoniae DSM 7213 TaxID=767817 RepID=R4KK21_9FIRM|nr:VTT domain-containing protein [Desulfoscipio gibsoniae]AGK99980.1 putative membrane protein [Desulfoscipio gibsoniae DSM 7213]